MPTNRHCDSCSAPTHSRVSARSTKNLVRSSRGGRISHARPPSIRDASAAAATCFFPEGRGGRSSAERVSGFTGLSLQLVSKWTGALPGLASPGRAIKEQLLRRPERDLNLDRHAGWCREAEDLASAVVARNRRVPGVQVREVGRLRDPAVGIGLLAAREEGLRSCRARRDEPTLDLDRTVAGTGPAAANGVEAEAALGIAPGLRPVGRTVELNPAPIATGSLRAEGSVVAVEGKADLPHVVAGPTAVGARRRG